MKPHITTSEFQAHLRCVARVFQVQPDIILSRRRDHSTAKARLALYHLLQHYHDDSTAPLLQRTTSALRHGRKRFRGWLSWDQQLKSLVSERRAA